MLIDACHAARRLRQAGAALCCFISFFTTDHLATAHAKGAANHESVFRPPLAPENVSVADLTILVPEVRLICPVEVSGLSASVTGEVLFPGPKCIRVLTRDK